MSSQTAEEFASQGLEASVVGDFLSELVIPSQEEKPEKRMLTLRKLGLKTIADCIDLPVGVIESEITPLQPGT